MRKVFFLAATLVSAVFFQSCKSDDNFVMPPSAEVTMVNLYTNTNVVNYAVDDRLVQTLKVGNVFEYKDYMRTRVLPGERNIQARELQGKIAEYKTPIEVNKYYSTYLGGTFTKPVYFVTQDMIAEQDKAALENKSGIRFFNVSSDDTAVTLQIDEDIVLDRFKDRVTDTQESVALNQQYDLIETKTYKFTVLGPDQEILAVSKENTTFKKGIVYTIVFYGNKDNAAKPNAIGVIGNKLN
ncbi:DUF4397 domain-containing protein [Myroides pelagicus]|uniref:DUF4397 domain-containing protein n=1 Tax=Myroides pelagicus TaxID=270914 RepID=A0A7K1GM69_9FLAO|nr:DUF4397 domain-containing protein [Myroides pelagicus]MEC4114312.1 DUF4397 domain-containing protein [Myroides pelagicus]MTH29840.1 hypothetical protein [Myroides pelagicus]